MGWQIYLATARTNLHTAQLAYDHDDFDSCVSRVYFAVFQAEIAALLKLTSFRQERWGHDRVQAEFSRRLIRDQKVFPSALRFIHNDLIGRRHTADYSPHHVGARAAERCLRKASKMVSSIGDVLKQP